jgi:hypothetical protein
MGNCYSTTNDVVVLNDMLLHHEEQIEDVRKSIGKNSAGDDVNAQQQQHNNSNLDLRRKLIDMEHERELLQTSILQIMKKNPTARYGRKHWKTTAAVTTTNEDVANYNSDPIVVVVGVNKSIPTPIRTQQRSTRRGGWKITSFQLDSILGRANHRRFRRRRRRHRGGVPAYICIHDHSKKKMDDDDHDDDMSDTSYFSAVSQLDYENDDDDNNNNHNEGHSTASNHSITSTVSLRWLFWLKNIANFWSFVIGGEPNSNDNNRPTPITTTTTGQWFQPPSRTDLLSCERITFV